MLLIVISLKDILQIVFESVGISVEFILFYYPQIIH